MFGSQDKRILSREEGKPKHWMKILLPSLTFIYPFFSSKNLFGQVKNAISLEEKTDTHELLLCYNQCKKKTNVDNFFFFFLNQPAKIPNSYDERVGNPTSPWTNPKSGFYLIL